MKIKLLYVGVFLLFAQNISSQEFSNEEKISLFKYAAEKYNEGDYLLTIEFCTRIINKSADAETFWLRAKAYRGKGDFENAGKDYSEAIQYHQRQYGKKDPNLSYDNALMYICLKRFDKALFELND